MKYAAFVAVVALFAAALFFRRWTSRPRQSDFDTIDAYASSKSLQVREIREGGSHWRYWLQGKLLLSNLARIYVIDAMTADGKRKEIHIAFDPMNPSDILKVLEENVVPD